jgi:triacylglycerol lipase
MNILLVPGVLGFDRLGPVEYFQGVSGFLETAIPGLHVQTARTDPLGTVEDRACKLAQEITRLFGSSEALHIVAHSLGGWDTRFLVSHDLSGLSSRVRTVATIGTPHAGSPIATAIDAANPFEWVPRIPAVTADLIEELRSKLDALHDLSEAGAAHLNERCPDQAAVTYLEVAGVGRSFGAPTSWLYSATYQILKTRAGPNDGLVPVSSALRARPGFAVWAGDHADLIGHHWGGLGPEVSAPFNHLLAYQDLIQRGIVEVT